QVLHIPKWACPSVTCSARSRLERARSHSPLVRPSAQRTLRREAMRARVRTAVILGAGMGVRLAELGRAAPKGFLRLGSRPIIAESLARLVAAGIERVVIVTGHPGEFYENL